MIYIDLDNTITSMVNNNS